MPKIDPKILEQYVVTANSGKYKSWEEVNEKFPELKGYDPKLLEQYVVTANSGKYKSWDEVNSKFPEFNDAEESKKKAQATPKSTKPSLEPLSSTQGGGIGGNLQEVLQQSAKAGAGGKQESALVRGLRGHDKASEAMFKNGEVAEVGKRLSNATVDLATNSLKTLIKFGSLYNQHTRGLAPEERATLVAPEMSAVDSFNDYMSFKTKELPEDEGISPRSVIYKIAETAPIMFAAALTGGGTAALGYGTQAATVAGSIPVFLSSFYPAYQEGKDRGLNENAAMLRGGTIASLESAITMIMPEYKLLKTKLPKGYTDDLIETWAKNKDKGMSVFMKDWGAKVGLENVEEALVYAGTNMTDYALGEATNDPDFYNAPSLEQVGKDLLFTALVTTGAAGPMALGGSANINSELKKKAIIEASKDLESSTAMIEGLVNEGLIDAESAASFITSAEKVATAREASPADLSEEILPDVAELMSERDAVKESMFDIEAQIGVLDEAFIPEMKAKIEQAKAKVQELNNRILEISTNGQSAAGVEVPDSQADTDSETGAKVGDTSNQVTGTPEGEAVVTDAATDGEVITIGDEQVVNTPEAITARIAEIETELSNDLDIEEREVLESKLNQLNDAIKESSKQEQEGNTEGSVVQPVGTEEGQQKAGEGEGSERQATQPKADDSDSTQPSGESVVQEPTPEQKLREVLNGEVVTYEYSSMDEVPDLLKDKVSSYGELDGKPFVKVTISKSEAAYIEHLAKEAAKETPEQKEAREAEERKVLAKEIVDERKKIEVPKAEFEQTLLRQFEQIPGNFFGTLSKTSLAKLSKAIKNIKEDPSGLSVIRSAVDKYNAQTLGGEILDSDNDLGRVIAEVSKEGEDLDIDDIPMSPEDKVADIIDKTANPEAAPLKRDLKHKMAKKVIYQIDRVLNGIKNNTVYTNMVNRVVGSHEASQKNLEDNIDRPFIRLLEKAVKSRGWSVMRERELAMKTSFYMHEKMHQSNIEADPETGEMKPSRVNPSISTIIDSMNKSAGEYSPKEIRYMGQLLKKYYNKETGKIDIDKMWKEEFNTAERNVINFMRKTLDEDVKPKFLFMDNAYRNGDAKMSKDYFPRKTLKVNEVISKEQYLGSLFGDGESINSNSAKAKTETAPAIDLNPFIAFLNASKEAYIQYYVVPSLHEVKAIRQYVDKNGDANARASIDAVNDALNDIIYYAYKMPKIQAEDSLAAAILKAGLRNVPLTTLVSPRRLINEIFTNSGVFALVNAKTILKNRKVAKAVNDASINKIQKMFGSTQLERLNRRGFQTDAKTYDQGMQISSLFDLKDKDASDYVSRVVKDFFVNGLLQKWGRGFTRGYYAIADSSAPIIWKSSFASSFKKITGSEFDADAFNNKDNVYADKYRMQIRKAIAMADQDLSTQFQSASQLEQKLSVQADKHDNMFLHTIKNYMQSFAYSENQALKDAGLSLMGKGGMTKMKAAAVLSGITVRAYGYQLMGQLLLNWAEGMLGLDEEDDEELAEIMKREAIDATYMFALLAALGNKNALVKASSLIVANIALKAYRNANDEDFDPYKDAIGFAPNPDNPDMTRLLGPTGTLLGIADRSITTIDDMIQKAGSEDGLEKEDVITLQNKLLVLDMSAFFLGLPAKGDMAMLLKAWEKQKEDE